ncbi:TPM domain-containing protein [Sphingomonas sp. AOB5]|uniref:TPM domain-containing protein n=1 Tax=Sphingomonas sp. AOB5 TaxID=3034017 RepID=UPI0023F8E793|nr:TPM domain-containing protein [Sphingomonas sp. AOB5]MDF7777488.1 TPM domain-containing protein [Sphingomonas sp. AOB5]
MAGLALLAACGGAGPQVNETVANVAVTATPEPVATRHVIDDAGLISPQGEASIQARLAALEKNSNRRVLVMTVPSLNGQSIDAASERIGMEKGLSDGVLLLISSGDRQMRLSVGAGAMKLLTDREASHIVEQVMRPDLRASRYEAGIEKGVDRIASELSAAFT